mmetsp:Transcript_37701/g.83968  ORF Transcript_37701/g.83968 Transcript_37701/m.83968 type:complete len:89 (-) Transcript_37701:425-691(-)
MYIGCTSQGLLCVWCCVGQCLAQQELPHNAMHHMKRLFHQASMGPLLRFSMLPSSRQLHVVRHRVGAQQAGTLKEWIRALCDQSLCEG